MCNRLLISCKKIKIKSIITLYQKYVILHGCNRIYLSIEWSFCLHDQFTNGSPFQRITVIWNTIWLYQKLKLFMQNTVWAWKLKKNSVIEILVIPFQLVSGSRNGDLNWFFWVNIALLSIGIVSGQEVES